MLVGKERKGVEIPPSELQHHLQTSMTHFTERLNCPKAEGGKEDRTQAWSTCSMNGIEIPEEPTSHH